MEVKETLLDSLFDKAEIYAKTNIELYKFKAIDKSADVISSVVAKFAIIIVILQIVLLLNISLSLWIGDILGKTYYGFFIVTGAYVLVALILHFKRSAIIKAPINDAIILQMIKEKQP